MSSKKRSKLRTKMRSTSNSQPASMHPVASCTIAVKTAKTCKGVHTLLLPDGVQTGFSLPETSQACTLAMCRDILSFMSAYFGLQQHASCNCCGSVIHGNVNRPRSRLQHNYTACAGGMLHTWPYARVPSSSVL